MYVCELFGGLLFCLLIPGSSMLDMQLQFCISHILVAPCIKLVTINAILHDGFMFEFNNPRGFICTATSSLAYKTRKHAYHKIDLFRKSHRSPVKLNDTLTQPTNINIVI